MPSKTKMKVIDKTAPIDIDGAMSGVGKMGLNDVEIQQEEQKKEAYPPHWSDDSGDESYGVIGTTQRRYFSVYGGHKNDKFYIPPSGHREDAEQGDHVIALNLNRYIITSLEDENIKTLPAKFSQVARSILPEKAAEITEITEALTKRIYESRNIRKETTSAFGNPRQRATESVAQTQKIGKIRSRLIEADKYDIHREIEDVASRFISMLDEENSFSKSRRANSKIPSDKGIGEAAGVSHLMSLDEFLGQAGNIDDTYVNRSDGRSGVNRGSDLVQFINFGKKYRGLETPGHRTDLATKLNNLKNNKLPADVDYMLSHISTCMSSLLDYSRTGLSDSVGDHGEIIRHDDEVILYKAIARLWVTTFTIFKNINSQLTPENKETLYNKLIDEILDKKKWRITEQDTHFVDFNGDDAAITRDLVKEGVRKFAGFADPNFETGALMMKDPNDPDLTKRPPTDFHYCTTAKRPKGGVLNPNLTSSRSASGKLKTVTGLGSDLGIQSLDDGISTPIISNKKSASISSSHDDLGECNSSQEVSKQLFQKTPARSPSPNSSETETLIVKTKKAQSKKTASSSSSTKAKSRSKGESDGRS
ncbi:MAG: hypothetical protein EBS06_03550 [Proteobacteria bacterium]|nr:hypothetical protein [Pseudomonadota bacterium]